jgi:hypothetical protein
VTEGDASPSVRERAVALAYAALRDQAAASVEELALAVLAVADAVDVAAGQRDAALSREDERERERWRT